MAAELDRAMFLISGPSAAGKSTVARLLAQRFARGVYREGDVFRRSIVAGREDPIPDAPPEAERQLRLRYQIAIDAADRYFGDGFNVVLEDVIGGELLDECVQRVRSRPLHVVVLLPSADVLEARDSSRGHSGYGVWSIDDLHDLFATRTPRIGLWIDNAPQTPEQTVDEILLRVKSARPPAL